MVPTQGDKPAAACGFKNTTNLKRHLKNSHPDLYATVSLCKRYIRKRISIPGLLTAVQLLFGCRSVKDSSLVLEVVTFGSKFYRKSYDISVHFHGKV